MQNKCEMKTYVADEAEKEKKEIQVKIDEIQKQLKELKNTVEVHDMLSKCQNKAQWANSVRNNLGFEEQA